MHKLILAIAGTFIAGATSAAAMPIAVTSYAMPNGDGQASGGSFNYWDLNYSGAGATNVDGAALSGGVGDLTDGVVASDFWFNVENGAGTGPYVGWYAPHTLNPLLTFNFAGNPTITSISIHIDNGGAGGVFSPSAILIDGISTAFTSPALGTIGFVNFTGLSLTGGSHTIEFQQLNGATWVFVSEVSFAGGVPEPASWAMLITGFGLAGTALRRRRALTA